jgi:hypothetical protein
MKFSPIGLATGLPGLASDVGKITAGQAPEKGFIEHLTGFKPGESILPDFGALTGLKREPEKALGAGELTTNNQTTNTFGAPQVTVNVAGTNASPGEVGGAAGGGVLDTLQKFARSAF